jgi:hypothetical protein
MATAELDRMSAALRPAPAPLAPTTARDAERRLEELKNNVDWYRKLMSGDIATRQEFDRLCALKAGAGVTELDPTIEQNVETTIGMGLTRRQLIGVAEDWRKDGLPDAAIEHILADGKFTPETVRLAQEVLPRMEADPDLIYEGDGLPLDREYQLKVFRMIVAIGTTDTP